MGFVIDGHGREETHDEIPFLTPVRGRRRRSGLLDSHGRGFPAPRRRTAAADHARTGRPGRRSRNRTARRHIHAKIADGDVKRHQPNGASDVEMERRFNDLRNELLNGRSNSIGRWLAVTAIFMTLIAAVGGYFGYERFRNMQTDALEYVNEVQETAQ